MLMRIYIQPDSGEKETGLPHYTQGLPWDRKFVEIVVLLAFATRKKNSAD
jgi:hypothetical protein